MIDPVKLDRLAEVAVRTGVNLQKGQDLVITAPLSAIDLVRAITVHAYKAGAGIVMPFFTDEAITLARYDHADDASFDRAPGWFYEGLAAAYKGGAARMAITGDDPMLLADQDPAKVARLSKATSIAAKPAMAPHRGIRGELEHRRLPRCRLGRARVPRSARCRGAGQADGCDL